MNDPTRFFEVSRAGPPDDAARMLPLIGNDEIKLRVDARKERV